MAKSNAVQFRGIPMVMKAYQYNDMPPFALLIGKQVLHTYDGSDITEGSNELKEFLDMLKQGGSEAYYTLQVYTYKPNMEITSATEFRRSFNFTIFDDVNELSPYGNARNSFRMQITEELAELRAAIVGIAEAKKEEKEDPEGKEMGGIGKVLNGIWDDPRMKDAIISRVVGLVQKVLPMGNNNPAPAGIAGLENQGEMQSILTADQQAKAQAALNVLCAKDPNLGDNLTKVANLILADPSKYKWAIGML